MQIRLVMLGNLGIRKLLQKQLRKFLVFMAWPPSQKVVFKVFFRRYIIERWTPFIRPQSRCFKRIGGMQSTYQPTNWHHLKKDRKSEQGWLVGSFVGFYVISTFANSQFYFKLFNLAWVHSLIVKNISILSYSVYSNSFNSANSV